MNKAKSGLLVAAAFAAMIALPSSVLGQVDEPADNRTVTMTATAHSRHKEAIPPVQKEDVQVRLHKTRLAVAGWMVASGPLNLYILIDEGLDQSAGSFLSEIASFIRELPARSRVAVGYGSNGNVSVVQDFTEDFERAAKALRIPRGDAGAIASPYLALNDLVKRLPNVPERREIVFLSSGFDPFGGNGLTNSYASTAIHNAQRRNVQIYSIYAAAASHRGSHFFPVWQAQNNLAKVADETGGDAFINGTGEPVSLKPFLDDIARSLAHQYML